MMKHRVHHLVQEGLRIWIRIEGCSLKLLDLDPGVKITQKLEKYQTEHVTKCSYLKLLFISYKRYTQSEVRSRSRIRIQTQEYLLN
jgi:hypothetical protein